MNRERLELLVDVLRQVPVDRFSMHTWGEEHACGTVACALGWAALDPRMNALGLVMEAEITHAIDKDEVPVFLNPSPPLLRRFSPFTLLVSGVNVDDIPRLDKLYGDHVLFIPALVPGDEYGYGAAALFFGLDRDTAEELFKPDGYVPGVRPIAVITRIEALLLNPE